MFFLFVKKLPEVVDQGHRYMRRGLKIVEKLKNVPVCFLENPNSNFALIYIIWLIFLQTQGLAIVKDFNRSIEWLSLPSRNLRGVDIELFDQLRRCLLPFTDSKTTLA